MENKAETKPIMNEQRLVTLILWAALFLGTVSILLIYLLFPVKSMVESPSTKPFLAKLKPSETTISQNPAFQTTAKVEIKRSIKKSILRESKPIPDEAKAPAGPLDLKTIQDTTPAPLAKKDPLVQPEKSGASPESIKPEKINAEEKGPVKFADQDAIQETSKANGTFYRAQKITEGLVIGKRSFAGDKADFYVIKAKTALMVLGLSFSGPHDDGQIACSIYDEKFILIQEEVGKSNIEMSVPVVPESTFYVKLNLAKTPVEESYYRMRVRFD